MTIFLAAVALAAAQAAGAPQSGHAQHGQMQSGQHQQMGQHQMGQMHGKDGQHGDHQCCKQVDGKMECQMMKGHGADKGAGTQTQDHSGH